LVDISVQFVSISLLF